MGKKILKTILCLVCSLMVFSIHKTDAHAAVEHVYTTFDHVYYADHNPDLLAAFGYNKDLLYNHYKTAGEAEGRAARFLLQRSSVFDRTYTFFRYDMATGTYYQDELTQPGYYFDSARYAAENPDVVAIFGTDPSVLFQHYVSFGSVEGRKAYATDSNVNAKLLIFDVIDSIITPGMTDYDKIRAVHDWIVENTYYDVVNYYAGTVPNESYNVEGVMVNHRAVCDGYSKTFECFMDALGIECERITGTANNGSTSGSHAWNRVRLNGEWYYIDVTWDDPARGPSFPDFNHPNYNYFLISLEQISRNHSTWMDL